MCAIGSADCEQSDIYRTKRLEGNTGGGVRGLTIYDEEQPGSQAIDRSVS